MTAIPPVVLKERHPNRMEWTFPIVDEIVDVVVEVDENLDSKVNDRNLASFRILRYQVSSNRTPAGAETRKEARR